MSTDTDTSDETMRAVAVTHSPATISSAIAVAAGLLAVLSSGLTATSFVPLLIGLFGLGGVAAGLFVLDSRRLAVAGSGVIFVAVVVAGLLGATAPFLVFGALATIVAFDLSENAFSVGAQLSDETDTSRGELVHAAASVVVGSIAVVVAYGIYAVSAAGQTVAALLFVLLAGLLLVWAVRT